MFKLLISITYKNIRDRQQVVTVSTLKLTEKIDVLTHTGDPYGSGYKHVPLTVVELCAQSLFYHYSKFQLDLLNAC